MKMILLRERSKPILLGFLFIFIASMVAGGLLGGGNILSTFTSSGASGDCNPSQFIACSDDSEINITRIEFDNRYYNNPTFWHRLGNPTYFISGIEVSGAIDSQLDTTNAYNAVWTRTLNDKIENKFINGLDLMPLLNEGNINEIRTYIRNYPNLNSTFRNELYQLYGLYTIDSTFNSATDSTNMVRAGWLAKNDSTLYNFDIAQYQEALDMGTLKEDVNASHAIVLPEQELILKQRGLNKWELWMRTIKRGIARTKLNNIISSTQSITNLELENQFILDSIEMDIDYLTFSMGKYSNEDNADILLVNQEEINARYLEVRDLIEYSLKRESRRKVEFVKWDLTDMDSNQKDSIQLLVKEFNNTAKSSSFENAIEKHNTFSMHETVLLSTDFTLSKNGLGDNIPTLGDGTSKPFYNIIGAGRNIIRFAFDNNIGDIQILDINSDRNNDGFNDIGVFYIKEELPAGYAAIEGSSVEDRIISEADYIKKIVLATNELNEILAMYELSNDNYAEVFDQISGNEDNVLYQTFSGTLNIFMSNFLQKNLRNTVANDAKLKGILLSLEEGQISDIYPIDDDNVAIFVINNRNESENLSDYNLSQNNRLKNSLLNLFIQDQKETANIQDNRKIIY